MNNSWMSARQTKFTLYTTVYVLIVLVAVGVVNYLANRFNKSYDSTSTKKFTLSEQTVKIAKNLKDPVTITYWDKATGFKNAQDVLDRYKNLSPKIDVRYVDVDKKKTMAMSAGVKAYGTIFIDSGAKHQEANTESAKALHRLGKKAISALRRDGDAKFDAIREGPPNS